MDTITVKDGTKIYYSMRWLVVYSQRQIEPVEFFIAVPKLPNSVDWPLRPIESIDGLI